MAFDIDALPANCQEIVTNALVSLLRSSADERAAAQCAAHLARACKTPPLFRAMACAVWDAVVDPGCVRAARERQARRAQLESVLRLDGAAAGGTLEELRAACRAAGAARKTGTKEQLREALHQAQARARRALELAPAGFGRGADGPCCPVRSRARDVVRALRAAAAAAAALARDADICASDAKRLYGVDETALAGLPCRHVRNPRYSSAAPMRLYARVDVARAALATRGPYRTDADADAADPEALVQAEARAAKRAETARAHEQRRREQVDQAVASAGLTPDLVRYAPVRARIRDFIDHARGWVTLDHVRAVLERVRVLSDALVEAGLPAVPREDSALCRQFVDDGDGVPSVVARVMAEMHFFHACTDYVAISNRIMDAQVQNARMAGFRLDPEEYRDMRYDANEKAKTVALRQWFQTHGDAGDLARLPPSLQHLSKKYPSKKQR